MPQPIDPLSIDAIAEAVAARLGASLPQVGDREELPDLGIRRSHLGLAGIELTQVVQHHGGGGTTYGADNSVPLVALKDLIVRAYPYFSVGTLEAAPPAQRVTGELVLSRGNKIVYRTNPTRSDGAPLGGRPDLDRGLWDGQEIDLLLPGPPDGPGGIAASLRHVVANPPLNFRVPAWFCRAGRVTVTVRLWIVPPAGPTRSAATVASETAEFHDVEAPRVALVRVNWADSTGR